MDKLNFVVEPVEQRSPDYGTFLFNRKTHLLLQDEHAWLCYKAERNGAVCGVIYFHLYEGIATSPFKAPFGSFEFLQEWNEQELDRWLDFIQTNLLTRGCKTIKIKCYPLAYATETIRMVKKLLTINRFVCSEETSSVLFVNGESFESKLTVSKKQKLKKCLVRFSFVHHEHNELERIYSFISDSRLAKGYQLSMDWNQMQQTVHLLPDDFLLFTVEEAGRFAAAAICIRVSKTILYTFYYAHEAKFDKLSPVTMLLHGIYQFAKDHAIQLIDLGTSQADGKLNPSLLHFKKSVGGKSSAKYSFTKNLE
ncbi:MAG: GNAT family N-acetyltransferase [Bacteroidetes bacterium]|nr:GNAT family N-acetyltransferase [Bacteroidota bacterium]